MGFSKPTSFQLSHVIIDISLCLMPYLNKQPHWERIFTQELLAKKWQVELSFERFCFTLSLMMSVGLFVIHKVCK